MKAFAVIFVALFAVVIAAPPKFSQNPSEEVKILQSESEVGPESFQYSYKTSDGQNAEAQGQLYNIGSENESLSVKGSFSFVGDDGQNYVVTYIADENGFQPSGAHLPVAPEA